MKTMTKLDELNEMVTEAQVQYYRLRKELKQREAELFLFADVNEILGRKATQKDKEHFVTIMTSELKGSVDDAYINYQYASRKYENAKLETEKEIRE